MKKTEAKREYDRKRYLRLKAERLAQQPPDPIDTLTVEERAYLAGLIDGEGALYIGVVGKKPHKTVYPMISIAMTHEGVLRWMGDRLNIHVFKEAPRGKGRQNPNWRPCWVLKLFGVRARKLCIALQPYFRVKSKHARIIIAFPCDGRRGRGRHLTEEIQQIRFALMKQIRILNRRGAAALEV